MLDFPITYRNASVLCQLKCAFFHKTVNIAVFFVTKNENTYPKGRTLMKMYGVVPQMKRENCIDLNFQFKIELTVLMLVDVLEVQVDFLSHS